MPRAWVDSAFEGSTAVHKALSSHWQRSKVNKQAKEGRNERTNGTPEARESKQEKSAQCEISEACECPARALCHNTASVCPLLSSVREVGRRCVRTIDFWTNFPFMQARSSDPMAGRALFTGPPCHQNFHRDATDGGSTSAPAGTCHEGYLPTRCRSESSAPTCPIVIGERCGTTAGRR